jgi:glycosyltransferase involved in cell wall biosynthesis
MPEKHRILLSHPTGNTFVRALLAGLWEREALAEFHTTVSVSHKAGYLSFLPGGLRKELLRRTYDLPDDSIRAFPWREATRMAATKFGLEALTKHEVGWASVDAVYQSLDAHVARQLRSSGASATYCYEDAALQTFRAAKQLGLPCYYDLPIAYWQTSQRLLKEEAERLPAWEPTLVGTRDSEAKMARKTEEVTLADVVICPSQFVLDSLPEAIRQQKRCIVAEFGSPEISPRPERSQSNRPLRVLFAGSMTQRKGLADVFTAMKLLNRSDVELVVMGSTVATMDFYRQQYADFRYEPTRPHQEVMSLMASCDVFVLPSIVEGRALVQQEAMMCGLPLITTANAGGSDLIAPGETGFLVPIRSPEHIAEKIHWFAENQSLIPAMHHQSRQKAMEVTWNVYREKILKVIA